MLNPQKILYLFKLALDSFIVFFEKFILVLTTTKKINEKETFY